MCIVYYIYYTHGSVPCTHCVYYTQFTHSSCTPPSTARTVRPTEHLLRKKVITHRAMIRAFDSWWHSLILTHFRRKFVSSHFDPSATKRCVFSENPDFSFPCNLFASTDRARLLRQAIGKLKQRHSQRLLRFWCPEPGLFACINSVWMSLQKTAPSRLRLSTV